MTGWDQIPDKAIPVRRVDTAAILSLQEARSRQTGKFFVKADVDALLRADRAHSKGMKVYLLIRLLTSLYGERARLTRAVAREWGLHERTLRRALAALESAGLVEVVRQPGRASMVQAAPVRHPSE